MKQRFMLLQATMLSLADPRALPPLHPSQGVSTSFLKPLMKWFRGAFHLIPVCPAPNEAEDVEAAADGLTGVIDQLQAAAVAKQGSAEQLQVLFVTLCRAHGMLVRSVR